MIKDYNTDLDEYNRVFRMIIIVKNMFKYVDLPAESRIIKRNDDYRRCE